MNLIKDQKKGDFISSQKTKLKDESKTGGQSLLPPNPIIAFVRHNNTVLHPKHLRSQRKKKNIDLLHNRVIDDDDDADDDGDRRDRR